MVYQCIICMSTSPVVTSLRKGPTAHLYAHTQTHKHTRRHTRTHTVMYLGLFTGRKRLTNHSSPSFSDVIELMRKWPQRNLMSSCPTHTFSVFFYYFPARLNAHPHTGCVIHDNKNNNDNSSDTCFC